MRAPLDAHSALQNKGCRLLARNCSDRASESLEQKDRPRRDMRMTGFIVIGLRFGRKHPSRDVIFSGQNLAKKFPKIIYLHDVLEPLKQALLASRDVIISSQICGSNLQKVFTLGDRCWLPIGVAQTKAHFSSPTSSRTFQHGVCKKSRKGRKNPDLSGPLNRLNAILSLLHPLDRYRTPSVIVSAVRRPYLALSRIHAEVGLLNRLVLNCLGGSTAR